MCSDSKDTPEFTFTGVNLSIHQVVGCNDKRSRIQETTGEDGCHWSIDIDRRHRREGDEEDRMVNRRGMRVV